MEEILRSIKDTLKSNVGSDGTRVFIAAVEWAQKEDNFGDVNDIYRICTMYALANKQYKTFDWLVSRGAKEHKKFLIHDNGIKIENLGDMTQKARELIATDFMWE